MLLSRRYGIPAIEPVLIEAFAREAFSGQIRQFFRSLCHAFQQVVKFIDSQYTVRQGTHSQSLFEKSLRQLLQRHTLRTRLRNETGFHVWIEFNPNGHRNAPLSNRLNAFGLKYQQQHLSRVFAILEESNEVILINIETEKR